LPEELVQSRLAGRDFAPGVFDRDPPFFQHLLPDGPLPFQPLFPLSLVLLAHLFSLDRLLPLILARVDPVGAGHLRRG
jgi:hypothetical protein